MEERQIDPDDQDENGKSEQAEIISFAGTRTALVTVRQLGGCGWVEASDFSRGRTPRSRASMESKGNPRFSAGSRAKRAHENRAHNLGLIFGK